MGERKLLCIIQSSIFKKDAITLTDNVCFESVQGSWIVTIKTWFPKFGLISHG